MYTSSRLARVTCKSVISSPYSAYSSADVVGGVGGAVELALAADASDHLAVLCHQLGEMVGAAVGDEHAPGQEEDPAGEFFGLGQVVGGEHDRGVLPVGFERDHGHPSPARKGGRQ